MIAALVCAVVAVALLLAFDHPLVDLAALALALLGLWLLSGRGERWLHRRIRRAAGETP